MRRTATLCALSAASGCALVSGIEDALDEPTIVVEDDDAPGGAGGQPGAGGAGGAMAGGGGAVPTGDLVVAWGRVFPGIGDESATSVVVTDDLETIALAGMFDNTLTIDMATYGAGDPSMFVIQLDDLGGVDWMVPYAIGNATEGDPSDPVPQVVTNSSNDVLVATTVEQDIAGYMHQGQGDVLVARISASGLPQGMFGWGTASGERVTAAASGQGSEIYVVGIYANGATNIDFGQGPLSSFGPDCGFVARILDTGVASWSRSACAMNSVVELGGVSVTADGRAAVGGTYGGTLWYGEPLVSTSGAPNNTFLWLLNAAGESPAVQVFGATEMQRGAMLSTTNAGPVMAGTLQGEVAFGGGAGTLGRSGMASTFVTAHNTDGAVVDGATFAVDGSLVVAGEGAAVVVAASFAVPLEVYGVTLSPSSGVDAFVMYFESFEADPTPAWIGQISGDGDQRVNDVAMDDAFIYLVGDSSGTLRVSATEFAVDDGTDAFVLKAPR